jgi:hypothetical protein
MDSVELDIVEGRVGPFRLAACFPLPPGLLDDDEVPIADGDWIYVEPYVDVGVHLLITRIAGQQVAAVAEITSEYTSPATLFGVRQSVIGYGRLINELNARGVTVTKYDDTLYTLSCGCTLDVFGDRVEMIMMGAVDVRKVYESGKEISDVQMVVAITESAATASKQCDVWNMF